MPPTSGYLAKSGRRSSHPAYVRGLEKVQAPSRHKPRTPPASFQLHEGYEERVARVHLARHVLRDGVERPRPTVLLADEAPITELDELRALIAEGQERGFLTFEQITTCLEEVEVTKEQVQELHAVPGRARHRRRRRRRQAGLVRGARKARPPPRRARTARRQRRCRGHGARSPRSTSRSSRRWTRCGCTCARSAACRC